MLKCLLQSKSTKYCTLGKYRGRPSKCFGAGNKNQNMCKLECLFWSSLVTDFNFIPISPCQSKKPLPPGKTFEEILRWIISLFSRKGLEKAFLQRQIPITINLSSSSRPIDLRPAKDLYGSAYLCGY